MQFASSLPGYVSARFTSALYTVGLAWVARTQTKQGAGYMQDRRKLVRHRVDFNGKLIYPDGTRLLDCRVVDMTEDGARLELSSAMEMPDRVYLWERQTNMVFECTVQWRKPGVSGVRFEGSCGHVMRRAIVEACSLGTITPASQGRASSRAARAGRRQRVAAR
jgi:PilZ domain